MKQNFYMGLTDTEVLESRKKYGTNVLKPPERDPLWKLFLEKFEDPIIRILLIAAFLSLGIAFINGHYIETIGIFCAILLATVIAFWFEMDANKKFDVLNQVNDETLIKVYRNSNVCEVPKKDIVVGDIVILESGEEIPADGTLLEAISLQVDESCLTGEPLAYKTTDPSKFKTDATYPSNSVMKGTNVMDGHGVFKVMKVGDNTEYGQVAEKSTEMPGEETPLNRQLDGLAKFIGVVGFLLALITFLILFVKDLFMGTSSITLSQIGSMSIVMLSAAIALIKVWLPIIYDGFELIGKPKNLPESVENRGWIYWIGIGAAIFAVLVGLGYLIGLNPIDTANWVNIETAGRILQYFMVAVTLIVVAVPEGLPMSVTLSLALSMRKMLKTNNLVRKMHACETIGAATVVCTDKTGTLTQNQMNVNAHKFFCSDAEKFINEGICVNSTAHLDFSNPDKIKPIGNPTEGALLLWLHRKNINYLTMREAATVIEQLTFSTERKYMATLVNSSLTNTNILYVKGAPEIVFDMCEFIMVDGELKPIDEYRRVVELQLQQYQNQAMRTLGFAYENINDGFDKFLNGKVVNGKLVFLGIVAISDPVRADVPGAVNVCLNAGIDVKIVTGDTPGTAKEIGKQIGIWTDEDVSTNIITGPDFAALNDEEALGKVQKLKIMCRARPTDKQRLVQLLQKTGSVVAVTGDGTNDAPALNHAHVGLSMGSGTPVAKEASDITLLDDSFKSITTAVMWGRSVYQNIQRFILFQLTINVAALIIVLLGSIFGHELPLTITQMLWVNLIMDTFAAGALASLPPNINVMRNKPRNSLDFIITPEMQKNILSVGFLFVAILLGLLYYFNENGTISPYNLSRFFTIFVMLQFWNMFNARAFLSNQSAFKGLTKSIGFLIVAGVIFIGQILIVEFGGVMFRTVPLTLIDWIIIVGSTSVVLWIGELFRLFKK